MCLAVYGLSLSAQYLWGIASGTPVVHPAWVEACIKEERRVDTADFVLPSGFSLMRHRFMFHDTPTTDLFQGRRRRQPHPVEATDSVMGNTHGGHSSSIMGCLQASLMGHGGAMVRDQLREV